ncbi:hypothetical protein FOPE_12516 [Fonsecaea pedrosoi]|nr:hypothetical protein FOPE_12516 [Fonsecaea pedrosoi]
MSEKKRVHGAPLIYTPMDSSGNDFSQDPSGLQNLIWNDTTDWSSEFWPEWPDTLGLELLDDVVNPSSSTRQHNVDNANVAQLSLPSLDHELAPALSGYRPELPTIAGARDPFFGPLEPLPFSDVVLDDLVAAGPHPVATPQDIEQTFQLLHPQSHPRDTLTVGRTLTPSTVQVLNT